MNISLTSSTTEILMGNVSALFSDLSAVITLIIGLTLAFFIISYIVEILILNPREREFFKEVKRREKNKFDD